MHSCDFTEDVVKLGWGRAGALTTPFGLYAAGMPFINEIFNLLTITVTKPQYNITLYPHHPHGFNENMLKTFIDFLAITGIVANATKYGANYSTDVGMVKGTLYAFFTFLIPNLFMDSILKVHKNNMVKILIGIVFIYALDFSVNLLTCQYISWKMHGQAQAGAGQQAQAQGGAGQQAQEQAGHQGHAGAGKQADGSKKTH